VVSVVRCEGREDIYRALKKAIELSGGLRVRDGDKVVIKLNLCNMRTWETGATSDPRVVEALLRYLRENFRGLEMALVESDATAARQDLLFRWLGFTRLAGKYGARCVNLSKDEITVKRINGLYFKEVEVPKTIEEADVFISLAKLKTHVLTKISCALKNQFGCLPYPRKVKYHENLDGAIVDANLAMRPDFSIVDGIIAVETEKGPTYGKPKKAGLLIAGADPVSVDCVCARIMGFNPLFVGHVRKAAKKGVGSMRYVVEGEDLKRLSLRFSFNPVIASGFKLVSWLRTRRHPRN